ncbi:hypothetical protein AC578_702 [Pseudocercospora eumusae]|uniref:Uncharacterized protein n=1 Tax=Pseudocercospora eumusae TaxID=321146 RepID=A0A139HKG6_9PEZI|nr:hypothetical protein AC578_702 [Pseudocercospora eumusae]
MRKCVKPSSTNSSTTNMTYTIPRSLCIITLFLLASSTSARHIHHRPSHQHSKRATPVVIADAASPIRENVSPSITAGDDAIEDIQDIQEGLSNLPGDLLNFVQAVEARLEEVESMLSSLMGGSSSATESVSSFPTRLPPAPFSASHMALNSTATITSSITASPVFFTIPTSTSSSTSTSSPSSYLPGIIPVVPLPTGFRTSRITSTRVKTVTLEPPQATGMSWPKSNSTSSHGNSTSTFATTDGLKPVAVRTFTVVPAPGPNAVTSTVTTSSTRT